MPIPTNRDAKSQRLGTAFDLESGNCDSIASAVVLAARIPGNASRGDRQMRSLIAKAQTNALEHLSLSRSVSYAPWLIAIPLCG